jgi:hypothetical protein
MQKSKLQFKIKNYLIAVILIFSAMPVFAARFSITTTELVVNKEKAVSLIINTEDEEINAIELKLKFSPSDFLIKDISDANSIISLWVERPKFSNEKGEISFSGIIPGGYPGVILKENQIKEGQLLKIILIPKRLAEVSFQIEEAKVLLNDGKGTEAKLSASNLKFNAIQEGKYILMPLKDEELPESFMPEITRDSSIFDNKWFLVFATQDKGSGIDHYEILETRSNIKAILINKKIFLNYFKKQWKIGESPYMLNDQKLQSYIFVKAIDKAGNERIVKLNPQNPLLWYKNLENWSIIIVVLLFIYAVWREVKRQETRSKRQEARNKL